MLMLRSLTLTFRQGQIEEMLTHARAAWPEECCGLVGGATTGEALHVYRLTNVATDPLIAYEGAPEELFAAQRMMRERGEQLLAIYHSHPRAAEPVPSETDVRLAFYPDAAYLIISLGGASPCLRAFRILESEKRWEPLEYGIV